MTPEQAALLREPFAPELIGKNQDKLDFVGHAAVTDRLLAVDPEWSWDFQATDDTGQPVITIRERVNKQGELTGVKFATMWIRLTVGGVTRPAVGGCDVYHFTTDVEKLLISDAIKNGAMRFGVALDLWSKEDLHADPPVIVVTPEQVGQLKAVFKPIEDEAQRKTVGNGWAAGLPWKLENIPADEFDAVYASAMDAVEAVTS